MTLQDTTGIKGRRIIIWATLLALFLGAMDALIITAAMPSIISDLGGLHLYAWVYSAYFLARAVSLPVFGKLSDLYDTRKLFLFSISLFLLASAAAGASTSMAVLVTARVFQGIGAGGNFALVYIVLSDVALPGRRARILSLASSVWGISSIIGPTLGGIIVTYFSWRWIFYINVPLGIFCLVVISRFLDEFRQKSTETHLDFAGIALLTGFILVLLTLFIQGALSRTPMAAGIAMLSLSLGWSMGSLVIGRIMHHTNEKTAAVAGSLMLLAGSVMALMFTTQTTMTVCFIVFFIMGLGMGFVTLSTLLLVQNSLQEKDLGVSTSSHQFARTLGGTIGVGVCGGIVTTSLMARLETASISLLLTATLPLPVGKRG